MRRRGFTAILAGLLLLQWGTALGQCLRLVPATFHIEICTAEGLTRIAIPGEPEQHLPAGVCPACLLPALVLPGAPEAVPVAVLHAAPRPDRPLDTPPPRAPPRPGSPRGPPLA